MIDTLTETERNALLTLCVMAAYADGEKDERERAEVKRIVEGIQAVGFDPLRVYREALTQPPPIQETVARLESPAARAMAYEMAVCVCDADGVMNVRERHFLETLRSALALKAGPAAEFAGQADAITELQEPVGPGASDGPSSVALPPVPGQNAASPDTGTDAMILNYSILNAALELLPQSLATMAIIPLQMKMVYRIGRQHGFELDRGHIRDFLATVGIGLTSQVVEGYARKLLGGLVGRFASGMMGKMARGVAGQAAGSAFSFASTYALGQVAKHYYAGGRKVSAVGLKELFSSTVVEAKALQSRYLPQIQERARTINPSQLIQLIRGQ